MNLHKNFYCLLALLVVLLTGVPAYGQSGAVSIAVKNATLRKVFSIIEPEFGIRIES